MVSRRALPKFFDFLFSGFFSRFLLFEHDQGFFFRDGVWDVSKRRRFHKIFLESNQRNDSFLIGINLLTGVKSTTNFHNGFLRERAYISHRALLTAPEAMWMTPFSGPILGMCKLPIYQSILDI